MYYLPTYKKMLLSAILLASLSACSLFSDPAKSSKQISDSMPTADSSSMPTAGSSSMPTADSDSMPAAGLSNMPAADSQRVDMIHTPSISTEDTLNVGDMSLETDITNTTLSVNDVDTINDGSYTKPIAASFENSTQTCPSQFYHIPLPSNGKLCQVFAADLPASMIFYVPQRPTEVIEFYQRDSAIYNAAKQVKNRFVLQSKDKTTTLIISSDGEGTQVDVLVKNS